MSKKTYVKIVRKTNPRIPKLIENLKQVSRDNDVLIWKDVASRLEKPRQNYAEVNLSKINRYANENETVLIPGKVLGSGAIAKAANVVALGFSATAREKITDLGGKCLTIEQILEENPKGSGIRILQ
ncbi:50S ribosomal protein L18e [Methanolobus zinderi]|jgi:large subunit ribosomal protein L18e|uniref:Large ribosomal subunit protein eL18 n=1 Tax=Methanolobus zinderi TaxID=536044 RepID=A0A7D5IB64_9EURY|nr:50S ribosomal protein L18e [Methanolobus zinderi]KXS40150.1 MAG: 50S ribosomal protein L18e [Methanolobus sp. T82-4]QLC49529.1 50S ribosomal protein L18e [Methanolobus zinderi]